MKKYTNPRVCRHIAGSFCVIQFPRTDWDVDLYIDARKDRRQPNYTFIEVVLNGRVKMRETIHNSEAPARIIELMYDPLKGRKHAQYYSSSTTETHHRPANRSGDRLLMAGC